MAKDARFGSRFATDGDATHGRSDRGRAQLTLDSIGDAVVSIDLAGTVTYLNAVAEGMTGWSMNDACGRPSGEVLRVVDAESREPALSPLVQAMLEDKSVGLSPNAVLLHRDGREFAIEDTAAPIHDSSGQVIGAVIVFHDVGVARERAARMAHLAYHDSLTGLPNRALLSDRITQAIGSARRHRRMLGVLFIDVDRFKSLNDTLGHPVGDELLQAVGRSLSACVRSSDTVSRLGGDEFVVLLTDLDCAGDVLTTVRKMLAEVSRRQRIGDHELAASVSIGIAIYPADGVDAVTLLKNADSALLHAKANGRGGYQFFEADRPRVAEARWLTSPATQPICAWPPARFRTRRP
jgi:diguanylate cyclase (GGDEF)-like protein/PAS domain S-box-containing protein